MLSNLKLNNKIKNSIMILKKYVILHSLKIFFIAIIFQILTIIIILKMKNHIVIKITITIVNFLNKNHI